MAAGPSATQVTPSPWEECGWEGAQPCGEALTLLPTGLSCLVVAMVKTTSGARNTLSFWPGAPWPVRWDPQMASRDQALICLSHSQRRGRESTLQASLRKGKGRPSLGKQLPGSGADRAVFPHQGSVLSPPCLEPWFPTSVCRGARSVDPPRRCLACFLGLEQTQFSSPPLLCAPS